MGKPRKTLLAFIDDIPDSKLTGGFPSIPKIIWTDDNYRVDMQGVRKASLSYPNLTLTRTIDYLPQISRAATTSKSRSTSKPSSLL
jgi:hypothetical protein